MKYLLLTSVFLMFWAVSSGRLVAQVDFDLPKDEETPVLVLDYSGGFRMRAPVDFVRQPRLQVFSDGRVLVSPAIPDQPTYEFTLSDQRLNEVLHKVVNELGFYEISDREIASQTFEASGRLMDAATVDLTVNLERGSHLASVYGLRFVGKQHPEIEELQRLVKIELECRRLVYIAILGGDEQTDDVIEKVNTMLATAHPEVAPVTRSELSFANISIDETLHVQFSGVTVNDPEQAEDENIDADRPQPGQTASIHLTVSADGLEQLSVNKSR